MNKLLTDPALRARRIGATVALLPPAKTLTYRDQKMYPLNDPSADERFARDMAETRTLYIGNLSFYTTEEQIYEVFCKAGEIKRIIMGLNKNLMTPCGFCFVEYFTRSDAQAAIHYIHGTKLDDRIIRVDWDPGFVEGRQYGRGFMGVQVRDELRQDDDAGRGGLGIAANPALLKSLTEAESLIEREKAQALKRKRDGVDN
jgi:nuclear cap-binding protein subunit 2